jgi:hypothetical protein
MAETCDCSLCRLEKEIAALREENERLRNRHIFDCCEEYKEQQQAEIERLRANALDWHKWPEEAPKTNGWKIGCFRIIGAKYWDKAHFSAPNRWEHDGRYYDPFLWAEMPEGE